MNSPYKYWVTKCKEGKRVFIVFGVDYKKVKSIILDSILAFVLPINKRI